LPRSGLLEQLFPPDSPARSVVYTLPIVKPSYYRVGPAQRGLRVKQALASWKIVEMSKQKIEIRKQSIQDLHRYGNITISFTADERFKIKWLNNGLDGIQFNEESIIPPLKIDFDLDENPSQWAEKWDIEHWGIFTAYVNNIHVGGAIVAYDTPGVYMLESRPDLACLWDIRVTQEWRRYGVGTALFQHVVSWLQHTPCNRLKIETQNNNVKACRFYAKQKCQLGGIIPSPTKIDPEEFTLFWYLELQ